MNPRPICQSCRLRPRAINYHRDERTYYRRCCEKCMKHHKEKQRTKTLWQQSGYQKKSKCDRCGLTSHIPQIFVVVALDGDLRNNLPRNLRTVCANCQIILSISGTQWRNIEIMSDF